MIAAVADGVWRWTARHPEWHPGEFGAQVAAWAVREGGGTVLVDPILPAELLSAVDDVVAGPVTTVITIPHHVCDAALAAERWGGEILGHPALARRLPSGAPFRAIAPGDELPLGLSVHRIGNPSR